MSKTNRDLIRLAVVVLVWYLGLTYVPQIVGTCMDGDCGFTASEVILSAAIPLAFLFVPIWLEMSRYHKSFRQALSDIGLTRFSWSGLRIVLYYLVPVLAVYPLLALLTGNPLALQPSWEWRALSAVLVNGLIEEAMMRGYVFRHLRAGRGFWRAAALSTVYFAGYHLPLILSAGVLVGVIGVIVAVPTGFLTAYAYERGNNTVWGPALMHAVFNGLAFVFLFPADLQPISTSLFMLVGTAAGCVILIHAYRGRYGRQKTDSTSVSVGSRAVPETST